MFQFAHPCMLTCAGDYARNLLKNRIQFQTIGVTVHGFSVQRFRVQRSTQNAEPKTGNAYQDVYDHAESSSI